MNKHIDKYFDEIYYTETLPNGLNVIIFHKPYFKTSICSFGTPYGALKINEKYKNKKYHFHPGIAHFLEHKVFEEKNEDMLNVFSSMGASVNAFTSYKETVYYFVKTGSDIYEPLNLLLDFVQNLNITKESVEKEKGIIVQELEMYKQKPDQRLLNETYKSLYHNYPLKYDVGGDNKSVNAITLEELETCYKINYHPSNMALCITSPLDPKKIIKIVRENQKKKNFSNSNIPIVNNEKEPDEVARQRYKFKMNINTSKHVYAIKNKSRFKSNGEMIKIELSLKLLLDMYFSSLNPKYQDWIKDELINDYFGYDVDICSEYFYIIFYIENDDEKVLPKLIKETLKDDLINDELLEQLKRRYISSTFELFNDIELFNSIYIRDYLNGNDTFEEIKVLKDINIYDIKNSLKYLNSPHISYVSMIKNDK